MQMQARRRFRARCWKTNERVCKPVPDTLPMCARLVIPVASERPSMAQNMELDETCPKVTCPCDPEASQGELGKTCIRSDEFGYEPLSDAGRLLLKLGRSDLMLHRACGVHTHSWHEALTCEIGIWLLERRRVKRHKARATHIVCVVLAPRRGLDAQEAG